MSKRKEENSSTISDILFVLKKNWILILIVVIISAIVGGVYAKVRKPEYIVKQSVNYHVETKHGEPNTSAWYRNNINFMNRYIDTAIAFCGTEIVLDRAEYYYIQYVNGTNTELNNYLQSKDIDAKKDFVKNEVAKKSQIQIPVRDKKKAEFEFARIQTYTYSNEDASTGYVFEISYKDTTIEKATAKAKILVLASAVEGSDFFSGVDTFMEDLGTLSVQRDMSTTKILILAVVLGLVLSLIVIYIKNAMDYTVKTKEDLEQITGSSVLACIDKQEDLTDKFSRNKVKGGK